jgi:hypothetical protein
VIARVVAVRVVPDVDVAAALAVEDGHAEPLPLRALFVDRFAGFLSAGCILRHGLIHRDDPARGLQPAGVSFDQRPEEPVCLYLSLRAYRS